MADAGDLKSPGGNPVRVQFPPPAPKPLMLWAVFEADFPIRPPGPDCLWIFRFRQIGGSFHAGKDAVDELFEAPFEPEPFAAMMLDVRSDGWEQS